MRTLLLDNYDSYSQNLHELLARVTGTEPVVVANDRTTADAVLASDFDALVISPGPGSPAEPADVGIGAELVARADVPILGVCLGHQLIAHHAGAGIEHAEYPAHGIISRISAGDDPLFRGFPRSFDVVRYHSLAVSRPLPPSLREIAVAEDGTVMAVRDRRRPIWGVQFHPEAACSEHGERLVRNFQAIVESRRGWSGVAARPAAAPFAAARPAAASAVRGSRRDAQRLVLTRRELDPSLTPAMAFEHLYRGRAFAFWLDTNTLRATHGWSFMGAPTTMRDHVLTAGGTVVTRTDPAGRSVSRPVPSVWRHLEDLLGRYTVDSHPSMPFAGGYVGSLGYGLATATIGAARPATRHPDLALLFVTRFLAFDHRAGRAYACAVHAEAETAEAHSWLDSVDGALRQAATALEDEPAGPAPVVDRTWLPGAVDSAGRYQAKVEECIAEIRRGETYEVCLTTGFEGPPLRDPLGVYRLLRRVNPAPYSAYLAVGPLQVLSSSPERFLRISPDGRVESRPIKGTCARRADPGEDRRAAERLAADPKVRAENMMIVDLLRNDLNRVCRVGSVEVESLMHVESYQTVHQLVSTIAGRLAPESTPLAAVESCFPGGSMTGAPKLRTMEIISRLESHARGMYAGALGAFSLDGYVDLSIVIRTIVNDPAGWFVGAGGAVLLGSDPVAEYQEMCQKAAPPITAISWYDSRLRPDGPVTTAAGEH
ncbi:para-aminobenzoate synthetase [Actinoplanes cyaneus]|nr:para-aminobenzoate synthetase [Actinoplanes cyaneus]